MTYWITISICIVLLVIIFQDLKSRAISIWVFPVFLIVTGTWFYQEFRDWQTLVLNIGFISLLMVGLVIYVSIRNRQFTNILKDWFGLGDVLFLFLMSPLFSSRNLVLFIILGMLFSLAIHLIIKQFVKDNSYSLTIPLAGYLSIVLTGLFITNLFTSINLFYFDLI